MGGDPAELAYGHGLAMLGDPDAAGDVAITALRRAGRARGSVLAHARAEAVARAAAEPPVDLASAEAAVLDLTALAATLASTRPPAERAALDLRARTGGDLAALGEAFRARPSAAAERCNDIAELWERTLDPALLAFSGPGDCVVLAEILNGTDVDTVAGLLAIAPAVHTHAHACVLCGDRLRAMTPVRALFGDTDVDVPAPVRAVSRVSRTKRPSANPAPLFADDAPSSPRRLFTPARVAVGLVALIGATAAFAYGATRDSAPGTLTRLTRLSKSDGLSIGIPAVTGQVATVSLHNPTDTILTYRATASAAWAAVTPARDSVAPHATRTIVVRALDAAPEGENRVVVTVKTGSGASAAQEVRFTIEHAPDVDATANGCVVDVNVVEEGKLTSLVLHWRDTVDHEVGLTEGPSGYEAALAPNGAPLTYWVTATDDRGNQTRTADQTIPADAC